MTNNFFEQGLYEKAEKYFKNPNNMDIIVKTIKTLKTDIMVHLSASKHLNQHSAQIGVEVNDLVFVVLSTLNDYLEVILSDPEIWSDAHKQATKEWDENVNNGSQNIAYSKAMMAYLLEIIKQGLEKSIKSHGLELTESEKLALWSSFQC
jgi:hypothetical protein